jgi:hypothetical protein
MGERRIVRRRLETEGKGVASPHQEQGHLDAVPAKEKREPKLLVARRGMALQQDADAEFNFFYPPSAGEGRS